jgi:hypothetical protein
MSDVGAPNKFKVEYIDLVYKYCLLGLKDTELADLFSICEKTLNNWKHEFPEFLQSMKKGKEIADSNVALSLYKIANGYSCKDTKFATFEGQITDEREYTKHYPPSEKACEFWLKNRQPKIFRDKQEIEHSGEVDQVVFYIPKNGTEAEDSESGD